jgi:hypothetical protein
VFESCNVEMMFAVRLEITSRCGDGEQWGYIGLMYRNVAQHEVTMAMTSESSYYY